MKRSREDGGNEGNEGPSPSASPDQKLRKVEEHTGDVALPSSQSTTTETAVHSTPSDNQGSIHATSTPQQVVVKPESTSVDTQSSTGSNHLPNANSQPPVPVTNPQTSPVPPTTPNLPVQTTQNSSLPIHHPSPAHPAQASHTPMTAWNSSASQALPFGIPLPPTIAPKQESTPNPPPMGLNQASTSNATHIGGFNQQNTSSAPQQHPGSQHLPLQPVLSPPLVPQSLMPGAHSSSQTILPSPHVQSQPQVAPGLLQAGLPPTSTIPLDRSLPIHNIPTTSVAVSTASLHPNATHPQVPPHQPLVVGAPTQAYRQEKFETALDFLDQVKLQFANQPKVYNQFLDIMKDFKAQCIDTPGVIARVSDLFKGHRNLILGFNTFLPPGYKIEYPPEEEEPQISQAPRPTQVPPVGQQPPAPATAVPPSMLPGQAGAPTVQGLQSQAQPIMNAQRKQPEFDHARNYVKKIKMRFANQPHIYKAFLEILHTYHKEQHTIKDVYEQVANLFANHPDLLEEFTQFLPDPMANSNAPQAVNRSKKPKGGKAPAPKAEKQPPPKKPQRAAAKKEKPQATYGEEKMVANGTYEELNFFYKVKQRLNNQQLFYEFLKSLNLYSQGIVSKVELSVIVKDLLDKHKDMYEWFKQFIGVDDAQIAEYRLEFLEREPERLPYGQSPYEIDFKNCKRYGPSYRLLPKNFVHPVCSGRTELCNQVLNDTWVSMPTGSEDFGFKNLRKNQYEEILFKCEDDRFELDLVIELSASTIRVLEALMKTIGELTEEESARFKLDTSLDILHIRSIERVYGEKGGEMIEALYNNPAQVIPILLKRLKQKDQEWCKGRKEWNKTWREVNEKNYYKSLDHQSFFFKQNDKKNLTPKVLIAEIKQKYQEKLRERNKRRIQQRAKEITQEPAPTTTTTAPTTATPAADPMQVDEAKAKKEVPVKENGQTQPQPQQPEQPLKASKGEEEKAKEPEPTERPHKKKKVKEEVEDWVAMPWHLKYTMNDASIFNDIYDLVAFCGEKHLSKMDREKVDTFFKHFVNVFFFTSELPSADEVRAKQQQRAAKADSASADDADSRSSLSSEENAQPNKPAEAEDKMVVEPASGKGESTGESKGPSGEGTVQPSPTSTEAPVTTPRGPRRAHVFYSNSTFYVLFRLIQILYERLNKGKEFAKNPQVNRNFAFLLNPNILNKGDEEHDKYKLFLKTLFDFVAGNKDQIVYEDECRALFGIQAYVLFTLDRTILQLTRQLQSLLSEEICSKLLALYSYESSRSRDEAIYHCNAAELLEDERIYRFEFELSPNCGAFTFQLLDTVHNPVQFVDFSVEKHDKWTQYVDNYIGNSDSKLDPKKHRVFLSRNQKKAKPSVKPGETNGNSNESSPPNGLENVDSDFGLECRVSLNTSRLFYVENTEDYMYRRGKLSKAYKASNVETIQQKKKALEELLKTKFVNKFSVEVQ